MKGASYGIDSCYWSMLLISIAQAVPVSRNESEISEAILPRPSLDNQVCLYGEERFLEGQIRPSSNPCETCTCFPPHFQCSLRTCDIRPGCKALHSAGKCCPDYDCDCQKNGRTYGNGEKVEEPNPCNVCYCRGGEIKCAGVTCYTRTDCEPHYVPGKCCPKYDHCPAIDVQDRFPMSFSDKPETTTSVPVVKEDVLIEVIQPSIVEPEKDKINSLPVEIKPNQVGTLEIIEVYPNKNPSIPGDKKENIPTTQPAVALTLSNTEVEDKTTEISKSEEVTAEEEEYVSTSAGPFDSQEYNSTSEEPTKNPRETDFSFKVTTEPLLVREKNGVELKTVTNFSKTSEADEEEETVMNYQIISTTQKNENFEKTHVTENSEKVQGAENLEKTQVTEYLEKSSTDHSLEEVTENYESVTEEISVVNFESTTEEFSAKKPECKTEKLLLENSNNKTDEFITENSSEIEEIYHYIENTTEIVPTEQPVNKTDLNSSYPVLTTENSNFVTESGYSMVEQNSTDILQERFDYNTDTVELDSVPENSNTNRYVYRTENTESTIPYTENSSTEVYFEEFHNSAVDVLESSTELFYETTKTSSIYLGSEVTGYPMAENIDISSDNSTKFFLDSEQIGVSSYPIVKNIDSYEIFSESETWTPIVTIIDDPTETSTTYDSEINFETTPISVISNINSAIPISMNEFNNDTTIDPCFNSSSETSTQVFADFIDVTTLSPEVEKIDNETSSGVLNLGVNEETRSNPNIDSSSKVPFLIESDLNTSNLIDKVLDSSSENDTLFNSSNPIVEYIDSSTEVSSSTDSELNTSYLIDSSSEVTLAIEADLNTSKLVDKFLDSSSENSTLHDAEPNSSNSFAKYIDTLPEISSLDLELNTSHPNIDRPSEVSSSMESNLNTSKLVDKFLDSSSENATLLDSESNSSKPIAKYIDGLPEGSSETIEIPSETTTEELLLTIDNDETTSNSSQLKGDKILNLLLENSTGDMKIPSLINGSVYDELTSNLELRHINSSLETSDVYEKWLHDVYKEIDSITETPEDYENPIISNINNTDFNSTHETSGAEEKLSSSTEGRKINSSRETVVVHEKPTSNLEMRLINSSLETGGVHENSSLYEVYRENGNTTETPELFENSSSNFEEKEINSTHETTVVHEIPTSSTEGRINNSSLETIVVHETPASNGEVRPINSSLETSNSHENSSFYEVFREIGSITETSEVYGSSLSNFEEKEIPISSHEGRIINSSIETVVVHKKPTSNLEAKDINSTLKSSEVHEISVSSTERIKINSSFEAVSVHEGTALNSYIRTNDSSAKTPEKDLELIPSSDVKNNSLRTDLEHEKSTLKTEGKKNSSTEVVREKSTPNPEVKKVDSSTTTLAEILLQWLQSKKLKIDAKNNKNIDSPRHATDDKKGETPVSLLSALTNELIKIVKANETIQSNQNISRNGETRSLDFDTSKTTDTSLEVYSSDIENLAEVLNKDGIIELPSPTVSDEIDTPIHLRYPYTDESLSPVLSMISDQLQFLRVGEEQPMYVNVPQDERSHHRHGVMVTPTSSPITVHMVKVVDGVSVQNSKESSTKK